MEPYFKSFPIEENDFPYFRPVMGGIQQCSAGYTYGPAIRRYYIVEYILSGKGVYTVGGVAHAAGAGECFIIRPYEAHLLRADGDDPWHYVWLGFTTELPLPGILALQYVFDGTPAKDLFLSLATAPPRTVADYSALIYTILTRYAAPHAATEDAPHTPVASAIAMIKKEYATIKVQTLADRLYLNRSYFSAQFKKETGKTPKAYIDELRMSAAVMMMTELGYTVGQAALATGYSDVLCFSKMYKRRFGVAPRESLKHRSPGGGTILLK
ncbi:MAG: helix-turn-helix domain-containing protein [Clostridia bacterium]|nr:helix-turn-helix domain-containing protein [Clostridia bacterium]